MDAISGALLASMKQVTENLGRESIQSIRSAFIRILEITAMLSQQRPAGPAE
jgi:hypothetical protein